VQLLQHHNNAPLVPSIQIGSYKPPSSLSTASGSTPTPGSRGSTCFAPHYAAIVRKLPAKPIVKSAFPVLGNPFNYKKAVSQTPKLYRQAPSVTEYKVFPDRGHSLTVDSGWKEVAGESLSWLRSRGL